MEALQKANGIHIYSQSDILIKQYDDGLLSHFRINFSRVLNGLEPLLNISKLYFNPIQIAQFGRSKDEKSKGKMAEGINFRDRGGR
jgi:hypothetical protein